MWKQFADYVIQLVKLKGQTDKNTADIEKILDQMQNLTDNVTRLNYDLQRMEENAAHERDKIILRLENILLRYERQTPLRPSPPSLEAKDTESDGEPDAD